MGARRELSNCFNLFHGRYLLWSFGRGVRNSERDLCPALAGFDSHLAFKLADPLAHSSNSQTGAAGLQLGEFPLGHPLAFILNFQGDALRGPPDPDQGALASAVA